MDKRERVFKAMNNEPVDRPPVGFWYHFPENVNDQQVIDLTFEYYKKCDPDMVKIMSDGYFDYPNPYIKNVKKPEDWYNMKPMGKDSDFIRGQVERVRTITEKIGKECCVFYNVFNPMSYMRFGTSEELLMEHIKENPEAVMHAFSVIAEDARLLSRLVIEEGGCDGIYYCVQNAEIKRFTYEEYRRIVTPSELEVLEYANKFSSCNILHCCGWAGDRNRMEVWQDYPAKVVNWAVFVENMNLDKGKEFFGGKCVLGGIDNRPSGIMVSGTREEVEKMIKDWMDIHQTPGMMIGADCTLPRGIDIERINWVMDTVKSYTLKKRFNGDENE